MHKRSDHYVSDYISIVNNLNESLTISAYHLLFVFRDQEDIYGRSIYAKDVIAGQYVKVYHEQRQRTILSRVKSVSHRRGSGAYAPLTRKGTLIVDNMYVSSYADVQSHYLAHVALAPFRVLYNLSPKWGSSFETEYHWYVRILMFFHGMGWPIVGL